MKSFFAKIKNVFESGKIKREALEGLRSILMQAVQDGRITADEAVGLKRYVAESGLEQQDVSQVVDAVFYQVINRYSSDRRITETERQSINHIAQALGVSMQALQNAQQSLDYYSLLHELETCPFDSIPATYSSTLLLKKGEIDYFSIGASMLEERVLKREIVGRSQGVSIRLMKGVSYRVGQSRGQIVATTGLTPISWGDFVITSQRLAFSGDRKSVNAPFDKIQNLELFTDGLRFSITSRQKPVTIQFYTQESTELAGMYISRILNA